MEARDAKSLKRVWRVFGCGLLVACMVLLAFWLWLHQNDPQIINYAVACIPVALTILISFVPDLRRAPVFWRIGIVGIGLLWSVLLWRQQIIQGELSQKQQEKAIATAVDRSSQHTDQSLETLRGQLAGSFTALSGEVSSGTFALTERLGNLAKPLPEYAALQFSFHSSDPNWDGKKAIKEISVPLVQGSVSISFEAVNISNVVAANGAIWIRICRRCLFTTEPSAIGPIPSLKWENLGDPTDRMLKFQNLLAGVGLPTMKVEITPPVLVNRFEVDFLFSCDTCVRQQPVPQRLFVNITSPAL